VPVFVRVTNFVFRVGLVPATAINPFADPTRPFRLGNTLRQVDLDLQPHGRVC